jgi:hypothetical protein
MGRWLRPMLRSLLPDLSREMRPPDDPRPEVKGQLAASTPQPIPQGWNLNVQAQGEQVRLPRSAAHRR